MSVIRTIQLTKKFDDFVANDHISLSVEAQEIKCIVGENGSGKSTLVKGILGLVAPSRGRILFDDGLKQNAIGYLPQRSALQRDFPASVREVVSSGFAARSLYLTAAQKTAMEENLALLRIADLRKRSFMELSGGQQQRVLLARALCATSKLLLLDEPVAGLDPYATKEMYDTIADMHRERGVTIIMISHDVQAATRYGDHILHLRNVPLFYGTSEDYRKSELCHSFSGGESDA